MTDPTKDPDFSAIKEPQFDNLVRAHGQAGPALDTMAYQLWQQLRRLGVDVSPSVRIRRLAALVTSETADLRRRQGFVKNMDKPGGSPSVRTPHGTYWKMPVGRPGGDPDLSYELDDAQDLPRPNVDPGGTRFSDQQDAVPSWIEIHRDGILREARVRGIPPEAITAAISWEAIENNSIPIQNPILWFRRGTGPGKLHLNGELANQLEERGYLPHLSLAERDKVLSTPEGAAKYIAAAMRAFSDVNDQYRREHPEKGFPSIRNDIVMLTQLYHGEDLNSWRQSLEHKPAHEPFRPENDMPVWVKNNPEYVAAMREALQEKGPPPAPVEPWTPPGPSPTPPPPPSGHQEHPSPSTPAPTPGQSPTPPGHG